MATLPTGRVREIESTVTEWMDDNDVPGASVAVRASGQYAS